MNAMREIKFRMWDTEEGEMVDMPYTNGLIDGLNQQFTSPDEDIVWMQFTGLKDKNGKEIYEGDIVVWETVSSKPRQVKFILGGFRVTSRVSSIQIHETAPEKELVVIGNIYENPELLKQ